jgi:hypothetical protein
MKPNKRHPKKKPTSTSSTKPSNFSKKNLANLQTFTSILQTIIENLYTLTEILQKISKQKKKPSSREAEEARRRRKRRERDDSQ